MSMEMTWLDFQLSTDNQNGIDATLAALAARVSDRNSEVLSQCGHPCANVGPALTTLSRHWRDAGGADKHSSQSVVTHSDVIAGGGGINIIVTPREDCRGEWMEGFKSPGGSEKRTSELSKFHN